MNKDIIPQTIVYLFESERFYAEVISQMRRVMTKSIPTAGVCIKNTIELHINPDFFKKLTLKERVAVLKHECEHILRGHIQRSKELAPDVYTKSTSKEDMDRGVESVINAMKHKHINVAADCAINYNLKDLPDGGVYPKTFDLPDNQTLEWYFENLKDNEKAKGLTEFDDHCLWAESEGDKETLKEKVRQAINKAANKTRAAGKMTHYDELLVSELNKSVVNWRDQLKRFIARSIEVSTESSRSKRNRRYSVTIPGQIKIEDLHIGVAIDTSGSVSDESLVQFMAEIYNISKYAKVSVVEADFEIKNSYEYKRNKKYTIKGRGGTAYKPVFDHFNKDNDIDGLIYFGDMDCYDTEELTRPKYPVLWAIVGEQNPPANFGSQLRVILNGKN